MNRLLDRLMSCAGVMPAPVACVLALVFTGTALAGGTHSAHEVPKLLAQPKTTVTYEGNRVTVTFGPVDLPSGHDEELAASLPKHIFKLPDDMTMVGFRSSVFLKDGTPLPRQYIFTTFCSSTRTKTVSRARASRCFSPALVWR
ncbi:MAG: hypothetical protein L0Z46_05390 [Nitrospiraceae bacterium]|nr:hypothetical protein [Nitrospiraceae bacterium]